MKREESIFNFHTACMEQACGGSLDQVSALYWDQNEEYPQFAGSTFRACDGLSKVMAILARQLNTKFRHEVIIKIIIHSVIYLFLRDNYRWHSTTLKVVKVDYSGPKVAVTLSNGAQLTCDQVIVAVPLSVLKKDVIEFSPPLPEKKQEAIKTLGEGLLEKVKKKTFKAHYVWIFLFKNCFHSYFPGLPEVSTKILGEQGEERRLVWSHSEFIWDERRFCRLLRHHPSQAGPS